MMRSLGLATMTMLLGAALATGSALGEGKPPGVGVVIISQHSGETMEQSAQDTLRQVEQLLSTRHVGNIQVVQYHFDKDSERRVCEWTLHILPDQLPVVGVVELTGPVVDKLVSWKHISAPPSDAAAALSQAQDALTRLPTMLEPQAPPSTAMAATSAQPPRITSVVNPKDGTRLLLIPAGAFTMGGYEYADQKPAAYLKLPAYYIAQNDVTNAQFQAFVKATGYPASEQWRTAASRYGPEAPAVFISWKDAQAYCAWAGVRLPTEAEWERAARGDDGNPYPWGDRWNADNADNSVSSPAAGPVAVGSIKQDVSPFGCADMAGNVWQWCSSKYDDYPYDATDGREDATGSEPRVIRGGSWKETEPTYFSGAYRGTLDPGTRREDVGFRVARSVTP